MRVELRVEARRDLVEAAGFYEQQREGLGAYFVDRLFEDLKRLEREGGIHEQIFGLQRKLSRRFPYAIYYRMNASVIDVVAVLDWRRDPESIYQRLIQQSG
jgi:plasmid stabilization system protein ParE